MPKPSETKGAWARRWLLEVLLASQRPLTDADLDEARKTAGVALHPGTVRARRSELVHDGLISECGRAINPTGFQVAAWCITWAGIRAIADHYIRNPMRHYPGTRRKKTKKTG